ncbi:MAG: hypothetical protein SPI53_05225 [Erysipelotrichaceae bacterium]|nr:hypothetical protein [Erysipelotrichaceae bacterium]
MEDKFIKEVKKEESLIDFKKRLNKRSFNEVDVDIYNYDLGGQRWNRPRLRNANFNECHTRYEVFVSYIKAVDYGFENVRDYVEGHLSALNKYLAQAELYDKNIVLLEKELRKEPDYYQSHDLFTKGYRDGLKYVMQAVVKSKEVMINYLNDELMKVL